MGASDCYPILMHSGVFSVPCRPRGRMQSGVFRDCLPAEEGHTAAGKEVGYYPNPIAIDELICRWELASE